MGAEDFRVQLLAQVHLGFGIVAGIAFVLHDFEPQVVERAPHFVELVLGLDDDLVIALFDRPGFLLLGERAEVTLPAPVATRAADPRVQDLPSFELHVFAKALDEVAELRFDLGNTNFMTDFVRHRHNGAGVGRQRRARDQNRMLAIGQPADNLRRGLLPRKLAEELLDVLNLEGALLQLVVGDEVFHSAPSPQPSALWAILAQVSRSETMRLKTVAPGALSSSTLKYPRRSN